MYMDSKHALVYSELIDGLHVMDDNDNKLASSKVYTIYYILREV